MLNEKMKSRKKGCGNSLVVVGGGGGGGGEVRWW